MKKLLKKQIFILLSMLLFSGCGGPSACDCAWAAVDNDTEKMKKCNEKTRKMTQAEKREWNKKIVDCLN